MKSFLKPLLLWFLLLSLCSVPAQNNELIRYEEGKVYSQKFVDSVINVLRFARSKKIEITDFKKILESDSTLKGWTYYYFGKSVSNLRRKQNDSVIYFADKGILIYNSYDNKTEIDKKDAQLLYNYKGDAYSNMKKYDEAITSFQNALDIVIEENNSLKPFILGGIANVHFVVGNDSLAKYYYQDLKHDSLFMSYPRVATAVYNRLATLFFREDSLQTSKDFFYKSLQVEEMQGTYGGEIGIGSAYLGLALIHEFNKRIDSAAYYYNKLADIEREEEVPFFTDEKVSKFTNLYCNAAVAYYSQRYKDAKGLFNNVLSDYETNKNKTRLQDRLLMLSMNKLIDINNKSGTSTMEAAQVADRSIKALYDSFDARLKRDISELDLKYQTREKDNMISQFEISEAQYEKLINQQRLINYGLIGFIILIVGLTYLFIRQNRLRSQYQTVNLEQRLLRSQMNPHFLGNAMNTISSLASKNSPKTVEVVQKISHLFRQILNNSREEFVTIKEEQQTIEAYLELQSDFSKKFNYEVSINNQLDKESVCIPPMFIQPIVENAIIHGFASSNDGYLKINLDLIEAKRLLCVAVEDNGSGIETNTKDELKTKYGSVSGSIINERLEILKKKFKVDAKMEISSFKTGTTVQLFLPYILDEI